MKKIFKLFFCINATVKSSFVLHSIYSHLNLIQQKKIILFLKGKEVYARKILFAYIYIYIYIYIKVLYRYCGVERE